MFGGDIGPVEVTGVKKMTVHFLHQPIQHIARTMSSGKIVCNALLRDVLTQFPDFSQKYFRKVAFFTPFAESPYFLGK